MMTCFSLFPSSTCRHRRSYSLKGTSIQPCESLSLGFGRHLAMRLERIWRRFRITLGVTLGVNWRQSLPQRFCIHVFDRFKVTGIQHRRSCSNPSTAIQCVVPQGASRSERPSNIKSLASRLIESSSRVINLQSQSQSPRRSHILTFDNFAVIRIQQCVVPQGASRSERPSNIKSLASRLIESLSWVINFRFQILVMDCQFPIPTSFNALHIYCVRLGDLALQEGRYCKNPSAQSSFSNA